MIGRQFLSGMAGNGNRSSIGKGLSDDMRVLGIETSCDETAAAVVERAPDGAAQIMSNIVLSQIEEHAAFGGVVPEIAARAHVEAIDGVIEAALADGQVTLPQLDAIAVTAGPGLMGGLIVGLMTAKALSAASGVPLLAINHLEGHALTARLVENVEFPYLLLLVSGGHTQIVEVRGVANYRRLGSTIDDALGEAFDKTAKLLGLPYPGGPSVEQWAARGDLNRFDFPRPLRGEPRPDFSFSGLKTAVRQAANAIAPLSDQDVADICASFQQAIVETLQERTEKALKAFAESNPDLADRVLVVAGGVAANKAIRMALEASCSRSGFRLLAPPLALCTDNAAMIAWAGLERLAAGIDAEDVMALAPRSRWPLDEAATPVIGSGKRGAKA